MKEPKFKIGQENFLIEHQEATLNILEKFFPENEEVMKIFDSMNKDQIYAVSCLISQYRKAREEREIKKQNVMGLQLSPSAAKLFKEKYGKSSQPQSLLEASRPLIKYLNEKYAHPHVYAIVNPISVEIVSGEETARTEEFLKD